MGSLWAGMALPGGVAGPSLPPVEDYPQTAPSALGRGGWLASESAAGLDWIQWLGSVGITGCIPSESARWSQRGLWQRLFERLAASGGVPRELLLDSTHVKAHRAAAGGKGGSGRKRLGARVVVAPRKSISWPMIAADRWSSR
jgi:transposase